MFDLCITVCSHHFMVTQISPRGRQAVDSFSRSQVSYTFERVPGGRYVRVMDKVYGAATADRTEYRFHRNLLDKFIQACTDAFIMPEKIKVQHVENYIPKKVTLPIQPQWVDKDYQVDVINYLADPKEPISKFLNLQTGKGKSYCTMKASAIIGTLPVYVLRPMFIDKWLLDLRKTYILDIKDVMVIKSAAHLMKFLELCDRDEMDAKVVVVSNRILQGWIKLYEELHEGVVDAGYNCYPQQFYEKMRAGVRIIDEVHLDFHLNYKVDLYTHVPHSIALSATLISRDGFTQRMYDDAYPQSQQYKGLPYHKYANAYAVIYRLREPEKIKYRQWGRKEYSHHVFEESVMKNDRLKLNYYKLVSDTMRLSFLSEYRKGEKCLIFCSTIAMCTDLAEYLKDSNPTLDVRRYVEEDAYDNLLQADVVVSTLQSAGTAVDIKNLTTVIMTHAIQSSQGNVQGFGRLRELDEDLPVEQRRRPRFYYFVCEDIPKHMQYHEDKKVLLNGKCLHYKPVFIGTPL